MNKQSHRGKPSTVALTLFLPMPNVHYGLDAAAYLAGVPRRSLLVYCRAGFIRPIFRPPYGMMEFTEEAIHSIRRMEQLRAELGVELSRLKATADLIDEVARLRAELRSQRQG